MDRTVPDDPLQCIRQCVRLGKVFWTYHVNMRLRGRFIPRRAIIESHERYEIIEAYPEDKYLPSYLVYSEFEGDIFHILFAVDVKDDTVRIVTAYRPNPDEWSNDFRTRRNAV